MTIHEISFEFHVGKSFAINVSSRFENNRLNKLFVNLGQIKILPETTYFRKCLTVIIRTNSPKSKSTIIRLAFLV